MASPLFLHRVHATAAYMALSAAKLHAAALASISATPSAPRGQSPARPADLHGKPAEVQPERDAPLASLGCGSSGSCGPALGRILRLLQAARLQV